MIKKKSFFILALVFISCFVLSSQNNIYAATEVGNINYTSNGGVRVLKGKSLLTTNKYLKTNTRWKIFGTYERLDILYYDLGGQQYVPARYLDKIFENSVQDLNSIGRINYKPGYQVISWTSPNANRRVYSGIGYLHGQKVAIKKRALNAGHVWYQLINDKWLDGQYVVLTSEKSRKEKFFSQVSSNKQSLSRPSIKETYSQKENTSSSIGNMIIEYINNYRNKNGLSSLNVHQGLQLGSTVRANEEIAAINQTGNNNSVDHLRLNGTKFSTEPNIRSFGVGGYGENLAVVNNQETPNALAQHFFNLWINSPAHRANILNGRFTSTGITITKLQNGQYIGMQEFAGR